MDQEGNKNKFEKSQQKSFNAKKELNSFLTCYCRGGSGLSPSPKFGLGLRLFNK
jgi:hypothetical protein